jgi:DNA-binding FadR family transcriptional regulator
MGLLTLPFKLPLLPLRGVIRLAETIDEQAQRELHDPARVRRELEEASARQAAGEITEEELSQVENAAVSSLVSDASPHASAAQDAEADQDRS